MVNVRAHDPFSGHSAAASRPERTEQPKRRGATRKTKAAPKPPAPQQAEQQAAEPPQDLSAALAALEDEGSTQ